MWMDNETACERPAGAPWQTHIERTHTGFTAGSGFKSLTQGSSPPGSKHRLLLFISGSAYCFPPPPLHRNSKAEAARIVL